MNKIINLTCIIDDDPIYIFAIKRLLDLRKFSENYLVFKNGEDAINGLIEISKSNNPLPDLILLDINMPIMDGWEFLKAYKDNNLNQNTPIFITSSSKNNIDVIKAEGNNYVNGYISKPLNEESLVKIKKSTF